LGKAQPRLKFISFQSPTLVEQPPEGDGWIHEIKHDGYRTELIIKHGQVLFNGGTRDRELLKLTVSRRGQRKPAGRRGG
jgi:hypothetical protein